MQPLKITVPGRYWDSLLYEGRLYLFTTSGSLQTLDWDVIIDKWAVPDNTKLALECAFSRSDYLYNKSFEKMFGDPEVKSVITGKFSRLSAHELLLSSKMIQKAMLGEQDSPFPFPHSDSTIYLRRMFCAGTDGLHSASCTKKTKKPVSTRADKQWDGPAVSIAANYGSLAVAASDEGLYEVKVRRKWGDEKIKKVSAANCVSCNWTFYSIYATSQVGHGYLAEFKKERDSDDDNWGPPRFRILRTLQQLRTEEEIFGSTGLSWGVQDKLCLAARDKIKVIRYSPWADDRFEHLGFIELDHSLKSIVSASVASFGTIVEVDDGVWVRTSDGGLHRFPGEPTKWRIFPRSKHYENQLHLIYQDRLDIISFNHDYFINQDEKLSGTKYFRR
jgi:hypothetical protein